MTKQNDIQVIDCDTSLLIFRMMDGATEGDVQALYTQLKELDIRAIVLRDNVSVSAVKAPQKIITLSC